MTPIWTSAEHNARLGHFDQLCAQVVCDNASGSGSAEFYLEHSADGRNWLYKSNNKDSSNDSNKPSTADGTCTLSTSKSHVGFLADPTPDIPLLAFVRIRVSPPQNVGFHCSIFVTQRDNG